MCWRNNGVAFLDPWPLREKISCPYKNKTSFKTSRLAKCWKDSSISWYRGNGKDNSKYILSVISANYLSACNQQITLLLIIDWLLINAHGICRAPVEKEVRSNTNFLLSGQILFMFCSKAIFGALSLVSKTKSAESHWINFSTWWIYSEKSSLLVATFGNYLLKE